MSRFSFGLCTTLAVQKWVPSLPPVTENSAPTALVPSNDRALPAEACAALADPRALAAETVRQAPAPASTTAAASQAAGRRAGPATLSRCLALRRIPSPRQVDPRCPSGRALALHILYHADVLAKPVVLRFSGGLAG